MSPTSYQYKITRLTPYWSQQTASGVTPVVNCTRPSVTTGVTLCQPRVYHFGSSSNNLPSNNRPTTLGTPPATCYPVLPA